MKQVATVKNGELCCLMSYFAVNYLVKQKSQQLERKMASFDVIMIHSSTICYHKKKISTNTVGKQFDIFCYFFNFVANLLFGQVQEDDLCKNLIVQYGQMKKAARVAARLTWFFGLQERLFFKVAHADAARASMSTNDRTNTAAFFKIDTILFEQKQTKLFCLCRVI